MARFLVAVYIAATLALIASAVGIWRLRCEGFGCLGVGVAWVGWVIAFVVVLGVGLFARHRAAAVAGLAATAKITWWVQLAGGALAVGVWVFKHAA